MVNDYSFGIMLAKDDASPAIQVLSKANIEPKMIIGEDEVTILAFDQTVNKYDNIRFELEEVTAVLDAEGIVYSVIDGEMLKIRPETLDVGDENLSSRTEA